MAGPRGVSHARPARRRPGDKRGGHAADYALGDEHPRTGTGGREDGDEGRREGARRPAPHDRQRPPDRGEGGQGGRGRGAAARAQAQPRRRRSPEGRRSDGGGRGRGGRGEADRGLSARATLRRGARRAGGERGRGIRRQRGQGHGWRDEGSDAQGRRKSRRQARQPGGAREAWRVGSWRSTTPSPRSWPAPRTPYFARSRATSTSTSICEGTSSPSTATPARFAPRRPSSVSWSS